MTVHLLRKIALVAFTFVQCTASAQSFRIPTPLGEIKGNVGDVVGTVLSVTNVNPLGLPTPQALIAEVVRNPEMLLVLTSKPIDSIYLPVANAIIDGRNAVLQTGGHRVPSHVRQALAGFYDDNLMDSVRWSTSWNAVQNTLQTAQMFANRDTKAIALMNVIVFRDSKAADSIENWAHELHHVKQYRQWGVLEFAKRWVNNSSDSGPVEAPAYDAQTSIVQALADGNVPPHQPIRSYADCRTGISTASCDLYVANSTGYETFVIEGEARATGHGGNKGSMQLIMVNGGAACNVGAGDVASVDNDTILSGDRYSCRILVRRGMTARVNFIAPNDRADAKYVRTGWRIEPKY